MKFADDEADHTVYQASALGLLNLFNQQRGKLTKVWEIIPSVKNLCKLEDLASG